ncbi:MAG TPA: ACT domain-containing protein [Pyrinomonadaceae bacterium]|nr:ACT domain-containing protein [Pyrinomonadaceae bacterium]
MKAQELLKETKVEVAPETYNLVSLSHDEWGQLLQNAALSPRMTAPFMILMDKYEVTLLLDEIDIANIREGIGEAKVEGGFRMLTFDTELDFDVVGFMAAVSGILADAGISIIPISAFSRDHILIKQNDLAKALKSLGPHVRELC